jgi:hypothetical protein
MPTPSPLSYPCGRILVILVKQIEPASPGSTPVPDMLATSIVQRRVCARTAAHLKQQHQSRQNKMSQPLGIGKCVDDEWGTETVMKEESEGCVERKWKSRQDKAQTAWARLSQIRLVGAIAKFAESMQRLKKVGME